MLTRNSLRMTAGISFCLGILALLLGAGTAAAQGQEKINMGPEDATKQISVTVRLNLHNKANFDSMVAEMYDKNSANYHHWMTMEEYKANFAPTAKDLAVVREFLAAHNMKVTSVDANNHFVVAQVSVGEAQKAFNVQINRVMVSGTVHRVSASTASVVGPAAAVVAAVEGLSDLEYRADVKLAGNPTTGVPYAGVPLSAAGPDGLFFSADCFRAPQVVTFKTAGSFPTASYVGNRYGADITNNAPPNLPPCGYDAVEMQTAYGLTQAYNRGLDGSGQTIVIVDAYGSNTIVDDANAFSSVNGLPALTSSNFKILMPLGAATCTATNGCFAGNWQFETTLDVEWAHAMAPGANIVLMLAPTASLTNLDNANVFAIQNKLGNVISNSFGVPEVLLEDLAPAELTNENNIAELAAALGISLDISTGDSGDNLALDSAEFGINSVSVSASAASPFATGVGGTSTFLNSKNNIKLQTGWGFNAAVISGPTPNPPVIPPAVFGFQSGGGGGTSAVFAKPKFQRGLRGQFRQVPDIAMNADPATGAEVIITPDGIEADGTFVTVVGGTSLACPMFSGVWAVANQANHAAGGQSLGQAAPVLYELSNGAITDVNVNPLETLLNVSGLIFNPPTSPVSFVSAPSLAQPLQNTKFFVSALFQDPSSGGWDVFTFGTDSSLTTGPGWDNVTGLGTPNGLRFIEGAVEAARH